MYLIKISVMKNKFGFNAVFLFLNKKQLHNMYNINIFPTMRYSVKGKDFFNE
jgi:hypothetical protein